MLFGIKLNLIVKSFKPKINLTQYISDFLSTCDLFDISQKMFNQN